MNQSVAKERLASEGIDSYYENDVLIVPLEGEKFIGITESEKTADTWLMCFYRDWDFFWDGGTSVIREDATTDQMVTQVKLRLKH